MYEAVRYLQKAWWTSTLPETTVYEDKLQFLVVSPTHVGKVLKATVYMKPTTKPYRSRSTAQQKILNQGVMHEKEKLTQPRGKAYITQVFAHEI